MQSRFEALRAAKMVPLVGRAEEMELLERRWQQAKSGEGRVVLLSGEAGIGKSRISAALTERLARDHPVVLRYFCLPHQQSSALQPIITHFQHAAGFTRDDSAAAKRSKLHFLLMQGDEAQPESGRLTDLIAELVGLEPDVESAELMDPKRKRSQLLDALIGRIERLASDRPVLMVFEDAHWGDPTSLELLTLTVERIQNLPVLLVISFRPEFQPPWAGQPHVTSMALNRLNRRERMALVGHVSGGTTLSPSLLDQIADRTDGVPLFIEESEQTESSDARSAASAQVIEIPETLQASLMARVDRLGSAREVLQIGSAIGREFSYELLAEVAGLSDSERVAPDRGDARHTVAIGSRTRGPARSRNGASDIHWPWFERGGRSLPTSVRLEQSNA